MEVQCSLTFLFECKNNMQLEECKKYRSAETLVILSICMKRSSNFAWTCESHPDSTTTMFRYIACVLSWRLEFQVWTNKR